MVNIKKGLRCLLDLLNYVKQDRYLAIIVIAIVAYIVFFSYYTIMKHYAFQTTMFDLGIYDHMFWKLVRYGQPARTPTGLIHNSLMLYIIVIFYAIFPSPITLLALQSIIIPLSAIPLYFLANKLLNSVKLATIVSALFLLYPPLHGLSQYDFHVEMFLPPLLFLSLYYLHTENWRTYMVTNVAILFVMEYASFLVAMMGIYQIIIYRKDLKVSSKHGSMFGVTFSMPKGASVGVIVVILALVSLGLNVLAFNMCAAQSPFLGQQVFDVQNLGILLSMKLSYFGKLFGPLAFMPLLSPASLIMTIPWLVKTAFTTEPEYLKIVNHYSAFATPFIFLGLVSTFRKIRSRKKLTVAVALVALSTAFFIIATDPISANPWPQINEREQLLNRLVQTIPADAAVLTQNNIAPHFTRREKVFMWPVGASDYGPKNYEEVEYILIDTSMHPNYPATIQGDDLYNATWIAVQQLLATGKYETLFEKDEIMLYKRVD